MKRTPILFRRYLGALALTLLAALAAAIAVVLVVDPYGLYGYVERPGFNAVKPGLTRYHNEIKAARAVALRPATVIVGNSRAEIGFDPDSPVLAAAGGVYNLAIPGTGVATAASQLAYLRGAGVHPRTVIVGLEFLDFLADPRLSPLAAAGAAPPTPAPAPAAAVALHPAARLLWRIDALLSLASVKDALRTLLIQHDDEAVTLSAKGFNPLLEYRGYVRNEGYYPIFEQRARGNIASYRRKSPAALAAADLQALEAALLATASGNTDIRLVIYPYHAQILAMFEQTGLWPVFEQWKQEVAMRVATVQQRYPGARITLVDFSGYGPYNCERIPAQGQRQAATRWYWEAGHFKKELGDIVLARLLSPSAGTTGFGMRLDARSGEANRQRIASERAQCASNYPALFQHVDQLAKTPR